MHLQRRQSNEPEQEKHKTKSRKQIRNDFLDENREKNERRLAFIRTS